MHREFIWDIYPLGGITIAKVKISEQINPGDEEEIERLAHGLCIDVGCFTGGSAASMLRGGADRVLCVDTFLGTNGEYTSKINPDAIFSVLRSRLREFEGRYSVLSGDSAWVASLMQPEIADVVFLDAAHNYDGVKRDIAAWWPCIKQGGIMAGHDYEAIMTQVMSESWIIGHSHEDCALGFHPGVYLAVKEAFKEIDQQAVNSTIWSVKKL